MSEILDNNEIINLESVKRIEVIDAKVVDFYQHIIAKDLRVHSVFDGDNNPIDHLIVDADEKVFARARNHDNALAIMVFPAFVEFVEHIHKQTKEIPELKNIHEHSGELLKLLG